MGLRAMKIFFKITIIVLLLTLGTSISADSIWDGSVSTARYGYLPQTGLYAASNAFPKNSRVTVTNPGTGKAVDVIILERLEDNNLFLVLSAEAAESIGIKFGDIFHGNISVQENIGSFREDELPYNPDPDVNPSANSKDYSELALIQKYIDTELGGSDDSLLVSDITDPVEIIPDPVVSEIIEEPEIAETVTVAESEPEIVQEDIPTIDNMPMEEVYISEPKDVLTVPELVESVQDSEDPVPEPVEGLEEDSPEISGMSADAPVLIASVDISGVIPELPSPESDIPVVSSMNLEISEEIENEIPPIELPELPLIIAEVVEDEIPMAVVMVSDVTPLDDVVEISYLLPEIVENRDDDVPETNLIEPEDPEMEPETELVEIAPEIIDESDTADILEVEIVLEPADPRPPLIPDTIVEAEEKELSPVLEPVDVVEIKDEIDIVSDKYKVTRMLAEDSYYLQLGAYKQEASALYLAGRIGGNYPITVLVSESPDTRNYKVMVGPLNQDESGAVLYSFKSTGYPDAFLRKGL